jgi:hypothetical protein
MKTLEKVLKLPFENPEMTEEFFIPCAIFFFGCNCPVVARYTGRRHKCRYGSIRAYISN